MKNKIKKIITTTAITAVSLTAIGCGNSNSKLAKNIDKSMADFVSSVNNLDYVDTSTPNSSIGKIIETSSLYSDSQSRKIRTNGNQIQFLNNNISEIEIENTITRPQDRSDNFKLYVLSDIPYISLTSDDTSANLNMTVKFSTNKIEETSDEINTKINNLILKRSILMIYVNEIYNGNVELSEENKVAINAYVNVIKENTSYLNGNRGMVKNQLSLASDLVSSEQNENLVNYYIIKSGEALETRSNKFDSTIEAIDSIIDIIENNLTNSSCFYQSNLSDTYQNIISNMTSENTSDIEITKDSSNQEIASSIANSLNLTKNLTITNSETPEIDNNTTENNNQLQNNTTNIETNNALNDNNNTSSVSDLNISNNTSRFSTRNSQSPITNNQATIKNNRQTNQNLNTNLNNTTNRFNNQNTNSRNSTVNKTYNLESQTNNNLNNRNISSSYNTTNNTQNNTNKSCPDCNDNSTTNSSTYNYRNSTNRINQNFANQNNTTRNYNQSNTYQNENNANNQNTTRNTQQNRITRNTRSNRNRQTASRKNSRNTTNNTINSRNTNNHDATIGVNETKPNSAKSVVNMNEDDKTMRADRKLQKRITQKNILQKLV